MVMAGIVGLDPLSFAGDDIMPTIMISTDPRRAQSHFSITIWKNQKDLTELLKRAGKDPGLVLPPNEAEIAAREGT